MLQLDLGCKEVDLVATVVVEKAVVGVSVVGVSVVGVSVVGVSVVGVSVVGVSVVGVLRDSLAELGPEPLLEIRSHNRL
jgi:hypothetical protein